MKKLLIALTLLSTSMPALAQSGDGTDTQFSVSVFKPEKVEATSGRIASLKVADGFKVSVFAKDLKNARIIAVSKQGFIYVSRRDQGDVLLLKDENGDGKADGDAVKVVSRPGTHGLAIKDDQLFIVTVKEVFVAGIRSDGTLSEPKLIISDLPDSGQHPNRTIAFGPDGMLYISAGSTCNACNESSPESATILRAKPDGKSRTIFASGLRNTIGFDWHPTTGAMWGLDHGIDYLGDEQQPEELNEIKAGKQYGWPHVWGKDGINPQSTPPGDISKDQWKAMSEPMRLGYTSHAAPMQFLFYRGNAFPEEYNGDGFATMRGSWNRKPSSGYEIVRVKFKDGQPQSITPFVTGFLTDNGNKHFARPVGLAMMKDGSLLMADDANGMLYRVAHEGAKRSSENTASPADEMKSQTSKGIGVALAIDREETKTTGSIKVTSPSFGDNEPIPQRHSEYYDGVSPALSWSAVEGAKSYAIILEDPDAKPITPYVHWVAWNIPATTTTLPEGLQEQMRLTDPEGLLQGRTSRGSPGYVGPRPPVGDPDHHYSFQVFALDKLLDVLPGSDRDDVLNAAKGHVIAKGTLVGTYRQADAPLK